MQIITGSPIPVFSWCPDLDEKTLAQISLIASLPFVKHFAVMPDAHLGQSMPIGGVAACAGVVVPNFVGVDIGCGMGAVKTSLKAEDLTEERRGELLHSFTRSIPVGFSHNDDRRTALLRHNYGQKFDFEMDKEFGEAGSAKDLLGQDPSVPFFEQLGTLGGGNHFCEMQADADGSVWMMVHSGSRNIGKKIGDHFNEIASKLNRKFYSDVPESIPFLPTDSEEGKEYLRWMRFALYFAFLNRTVMLEAVQDDIARMFPTVSFGKLINIHHNYASLECHFAQNLWVHRKGATLASEGNVGIIPGSMGTSSYITKGLGRAESLTSSSHGAGRRMGRADFNRQNNDEAHLKAIEESLAGVTHISFRKEVSRKRKETGMLDVSEAPGAYKDIDAVMANQADLVEITVKLKPLLCLKG